MGESITKERVTSHSPSTKFPSLHAANELDFVSKLKNAIKDNGLEKIMKDLGSESCEEIKVPVDMVVNATMAAIAKHGYVQSPQLNVYHVASASVNPVSVSQLFDYCYEYFDSFPFVNSKGDRVKVRKMRYFDKISQFSNYILEKLLRQLEVQDLTEVEHSKKGV
ncbi:fatty acyl-CoA reductase 2, chloroplastic-like [Nicotiana sylvestris]|uniref:fatty acyl-CoA reductase 2, chloroplastic-like n=1 Tax=Nicotiana sylvestris TaxID=4096 RepID=UPI00388CE0CF